MGGQIERSLVLRLNMNGWIIFLALAGASLAYLPLEITAGIVVGGLLVNINLHFLRRAVFKALAPGSRMTPLRQLPSYYLRFMATVIIIFILLSQHLINEIGLLIGLSVFVINVFLILVQETVKIIMKKKYTKEAV